jgi:hypothetical protein
LAFEVERMGGRQDLNGGAAFLFIDPSVESGEIFQIASR